MNTENSKQTCSGSGRIARPSFRYAGTRWKTCITKTEEAVAICAIHGLGCTYADHAMIGLNHTKMKHERKDG